MNLEERVKAKLVFNDGIGETEIYLLDHQNNLYLSRNAEEFNPPRFVTNDFQVIQYIVSYSQVILTDGRIINSYSEKRKFLQGLRQD